MDALVQFVVRQAIITVVFTGTDGPLDAGVTAQAGVTVTVAVAVGETMPSEAVSVYVVVAAGVTLFVPPATGLTAPTLWLMVVEVQFEVVHESVDEAFTTMLVGLAVNALMVHGEFMVSVALAVGLFVPSEAVSVYVVVEAGLTLFVPPATGLTAPTPWLMVVLVQFEVVQDRVEDCPTSLVAGETVKAEMVHGEVTVTVAVEVGLFVPSEAVSVYVVVDPGVTLFVPPATGLTAPTPWLMVVLVQFEVVHERVEDPPEITDVGLAVNEPMEHGGFTVMVAFAVAPLTPSDALSVYVSVLVGDIDFVPPATGLTAPTLWLMVVVLQLDVAHVNVDDPPEIIVVGLAVKEEILQSAYTVMVMEEVGDCVPFVAVRVNVAVDDGDTFVLLFTPTEPTPWLMDALVHPEVDQDRPTEYPTSVQVLVEVYELMVQGAVTVTEAVFVAEPTAFWAVNVYVVVEPGETLVLLFTPTEPTVGLMLALVQFVVDHERVEELPDAIEVGLAVKDPMEHTGHPVVVVFTVVLAKFDPPLCA